MQQSLREAETETTEQTEKGEDRELQTENCVLVR